MKLTYDEMYDLIVSYIKNTMEYNGQFCEYIPNYHIAEKFMVVLINLELEHMYPYEFKSVYDDLKILTNLNNDNYFNKELLNKNGSGEIYRVYEKLREKEDKIRNIMMLVGIELRNVVLPYKTKRITELKKKLRIY